MAKKTTHKTRISRGRSTILGFFVGATALGLVACSGGTPVDGQNSAPSANASPSPAPGSNPSPSLSFSGSTLVVATNDNATLTWSSANATSCTASGSWSGSKALTGSQSIGPLTASSTYTLACTGPGGNISRSVSITVSTSFIVDTSWAPNSDNPDGYHIYIGPDVSSVTTLAKTLAQNASDWNPSAPAASLSSSVVLAAVGTVKQVCVATRAFNGGGISAPSEVTCAALP